MTIQFEDVQIQYKQYVTELADTIAEIARLGDLHERKKGLERIVEGYELLYPALAAHIAEAAPAESEVVVAAPAEADTPAAPAPAGFVVSDRVVRVLRDREDQWFTARKMMNYFAERNWDATDTAIRLSLRRAADRGVAEKSENEDGSQIFRIRREADVEVSTP